MVANKGRVVLLCAVICTTSLAAQEEVPDAESLLRHFDQMYESTGTTARLEIEITRPNKTRTMRMRTWSQGEDRALIVIDAPVRDAGTATLKVGRNLWNYLPRISRTIRVPPALMLGSWMGSDLSNDDLVRESSYAADYEPGAVGSSEDPPGWLVAIKARPGVPGLWEKVEIVFSQEKQLPVLGRYYDRKGRHGRTMRMEGIEKVGDRHIATKIIVEPERERGKRTVLTYLHVEFDDEGKVERVWWTSEGAITETFQMVYVSMNVPEKPGVYPFKSWQKYADDSIVWFNEPRGEDVENPYPVVTVTNPPLLTAGMVQVGSSAIALIALAIALLSRRNHRKNDSPTP